MAQPFHQKTLRALGFVGGGFLLIGAVADSVSNAFSLFSPRVTYLSTVIVCIAWFMAEVIVRVWPISWMSQGGKPTRLTRLGPRVRFSILGVLMLFWLPRVPEMFAAQSNRALVRFLPGDLNINLDEAYTSGSVVVVQVSVRAPRGEITLTRRAKIVSSQLDESVFVSDLIRPKLELISVNPSTPLVGAGSPIATIEVELDKSSLIPTASEASYTPSGTKRKVGSVVVRLYYQDAEKEESADVEIPIFFHKVTLRSSLSAT